MMKPAVPILRHRCMGSDGYSQGISSQGFLARGILGKIPRHCRTVVALLALAAALLDGVAAYAQVTYSGSQFNVAGSALASPRSVAVDRLGTLYIADTGNNRVVSIVPSSGGGVAPTVLVSGLSAPAGVAADWSGNLYVSDTGNNQVLLVPLGPSGFGDPVAVATGLSSPMGLAADLLGDLFVADSGNNRVIELPRVGSGFGPLIIVGSGFNRPAGVAVDALQSLYIADTGNDRIVKAPYTTSGYASLQVLVTGLAAPMGVAVDQSYDMFFTEAGNGQVLERTWAAGANRFGSQLIIGSGFTSPVGMAVDSKGNTYVADVANGQVIEATPGTINFGALSIDSTAATLTYSFDVSAGTTLGAVSVLTQGIPGRDFVDAGKSTCIAGTYAAAASCSVNVSFTPMGSGERVGTVVLYDDTGDPLATTFFSGTGLQPRVAFVPGTETQIGTQLSAPSGVAVDAYGNVYIGDTGNDRVLEVAWNGSGYGAQSTIPATGLNAPMGLALDGAGNLFIVSSGNNKLIKLAWTGSGFGMQTEIGISLNAPSAVTADGAGNLYVADTLDNRVAKLSWTGVEYTSAQIIGSYSRIPMGVAVDASGDVYFTETYMNDLVEVPFSDGVYLAEIPIAVAPVSQPTVVAVDGNSNLYLLDAGNNRVLMLPWTGVTFGPKIIVASGFNAPGGMALDGAGNLYVADTGNNRVVKIDLSMPAEMSFATTYVGSTSEDSAHVALVESMGNQPLVLSAVTYPADFPASASAANPCVVGTSLSFGSGCDLAIDFTPAELGSPPGSPLSETATVTDNTLAGAGLQHSLALTGTSLPKLSQTISFSPISSTTYGVGLIALSAVASSGLPVTYQIVSGPATLTSGAKSLRLQGAGIVVVSAIQAGSSMYEAAATATQSFTVAPATLTVTPQNVTAVYGDIPSSFTAYTISGFAAGDNASQQTTGKPILGSNTASESGVGIYIITASLGSLSSANYNFVFATGTLTVNPAVLTVAVANQSMIYGAALPSIIYTVKGFVNGDTQSQVVTGVPQFTVAAASPPPPGKYVVSPTAGTLAAANYRFAFVNGSLTVNQAALTVAAVNLSMTYGGTLPAMSYAITGFVNGDTQSSAVAGVPQLSTVATSKSAVGQYAIKVQAGTVTASNYRFVFSAGTLTIQRAILSVIATSQSMNYGAALPPLTYSIIGYVNGDTQRSSFSGLPQLKTLATSKSAVGQYAVTAAAGTLYSDNYSFVYTNATLTITPAALTVTAVNKSVTYGGAMPTLTYSMRGFVNGDTQSNSVTGAPQLATSAMNSSSVGQYAIGVGAGTLSAANYSFLCVNGTLTVSPAVLTVAAVSQSMTYGGSLPAMAYTETGFVNGDVRNTSVTGVPQLSTVATSQSLAGRYAISVGPGTLSAMNYSFVFVAATLTINKAVLTVSAAGQIMSYGGSLPALTYSLLGFVNGDTQSNSVTGSPQLTTTATGLSVPGSYPINVGTGSLSAANYGFVFVPATLTIGKAMLTVAAVNQSMIYGGTLPALTYVVSGFVNGDMQSSSITGVPKFTCAATAKSAVGQYSITGAAGSLAANNYNFAFQSGLVAVEPAPLTIEANDLSMVSGQAVPALAYNVSGWVNGDTQAKAATGAPSLSTTATTASPAGSYAISITEGTMIANNYALTFDNGILTVTSQSGSSISRRPIESPAPLPPGTPNTARTTPPAP